MNRGGMLTKVWKCLDVREDGRIPGQDQGSVVPEIPRVLRAQDFPRADFAAIGPYSAVRPEIYPGYGGRDYEGFAIIVDGVTCICLSHKDAHHSNLVAK